MRRVVSVWFPHWRTDRLRRLLSRSSAEAPHGALVTAAHDGRRRVVAAVDQGAAALGLRPGMAMAQALAMVPGLHVHDAEPDADAEALYRLALWCHRYTPLASVCPPDGLWLDVGGAAHLFGGEQALMSHLLIRLARDGLPGRAAVADTPGAAHGLARHGSEPATRVPPGEQSAAMAALPVAALRLSPELEATLRRLGFEQVGHVARIPSALLTRRFGPLVGLRLDQMRGRVVEPLLPLPAEHPLQRRISFVEPLLTAEALATAITHLAGPLCDDMERGGLGARRLDLLFERIDNQVVAIRVGTAHPSRDAGHLVRMLAERLGTIDPGLGVEAMQLAVPLAEPLRWEQQESGEAPAMARLVDRLSNRLGAGHVYRAAPVESPLPEALVRKAQPFEAGLPRRGDDPGRASAATMERGQDPPSRGPGPRLVEDAAEFAGGATPTAILPASSTKPLLRLLHAAVSDEAEPPAVLPWVPRHALHRPSALRRAWRMGPGKADPDLGPKPGGELRVGSGLDKGRGCAWPSRLKAPARLLTPPRPVKALAGLPDKPPVAFTWRRRHLVRRSEGPERIHEVWWQNEYEAHAVRDYFQVEDEGGQRFWLFRQGNGTDSRTGTLDWFLHGLF